MALALRVVGAGLLLAVSAAAQGDVFEEVALRVASLRPNGQCVVDRGKRDLVQVDDRVVLAPRDQRPVTGRVVEVDERTALVELLDPTVLVPIGTRGHVLLPKARRAAAAPTAPQPEPAAQPQEEEWAPGMPLLGRRRPPQPAERPAQLRGRLWGSSRLVRTLDSFSQSFVDAGTDATIDNVDGNGGVLRFSGAFNRSKEFNGVVGNDLRLFELSYERGGTRFDPVHWQIGRFLPRDVPEFGLLDGVEIGMRREGGDRFGVSLGYLPQLDDDMNTFADLQFAAWYVWNQDVAERVSFGIGYQHTWHRLDNDRDLVVLKSRYLPADGWDLSSSVWIDFYDSNDVAKDSSLEVTRANVFAVRRWQDRGGIEAFYDHESYPDIVRRELPQYILPATLQGAHVDRVSVRGWSGGGDTSRWFSRVTGWVDEQRTGGAVELGVEMHELFSERSRTVLALFDMQGLRSTMVGVRVEHGGSFSYGRLDLLYELGFVHFESTPEDRDDLFQHRLAGMLSTDLGGGWDASFVADGTLYDDELSFGIGIYVQRLF